MSKGTVTIAAENDTCEWWFIKTPDYKEAFKEALKRALPVACRRWNPEQQAWCVHGDWLQIAEAVVADYFYGYTVERIE